MFGMQYFQQTLPMIFVPVNLDLCLGNVSNAKGKLVMFAVQSGQSERSRKRGPNINEYGDCSLEQKIGVCRELDCAGLLGLLHQRRDTGAIMHQWLVYRNRSMFSGRLIEFGVSYAFMEPSSQYSNWYYERLLGNVTPVPNTNLTIANQYGDFTLVSRGYGVFFQVSCFVLFCLFCHLFLRRCFLRCGMGV